MTGRFAALTRTELTLLSRNKTALVTTLLMPFGLGLFYAVNPMLLDQGEVGPGIWIMLTAIQMVTVVGMTVYMGVTTAVVSRRQDLYLKRLRCGELSDRMIIAGVTAPLIVTAVLQLVLLQVFMMIGGAPVPSNPLPLVIGVLGGAAMCAAAGLYTSTITATVESAQATVTPFFLVLIGTAIWAVVQPDSQAATVTPGGALAQLVRASLSEVPLRTILSATAAVLVWTLAAAWYARRGWRWEPRS